MHTRSQQQRLPAQSWRLSQLHEIIEASKVDNGRSLASFNDAVA